MDLRNYHVFQVSSYRGPTKVTLITYNPASDVERICKEEGIEYSALEVPGIGKNKFKRVTIRVEKSRLETKRDNATIDEREALERILAHAELLERKQKIA